MKNLVLVVVIGVLLSGCGVVERMFAKVSGSSSICYEGVEYIQFTSGASVAYNTDGSLRLCK